MNEEVDNCQHEWEEAAVLGEPAKYCEKCRYYTQITKGEFKSLFKRSFWKFKKEFDDKFLYGGYKGRLKAKQDAELKKFHDENVWVPVVKTQNPAS
jgi:hypothetical protein